MKNKIQKIICKFNIFSSCFTVNDDIDNSHHSYNIRYQHDMPFEANKINFLDNNNGLDRDWYSGSEKKYRRKRSQDTSRSI